MNRQTLHSRAAITGLWLAIVVFGVGTAVADALSVTFRLEASGVPEGATVFLAGGAKELGQWRPDGQAMTRSGNGLWTASLRFSTQSSIEYKFTLGSWEREGASADGLPLGNFSTVLRDGMVIDHTVQYWTDGRTAPPPQGQVTGELVITRGIRGEGLPPRDLLVLLPPGYHDAPGRRYPVLYMHDGQNLFDPVTSSFGVDWGVDESVDRLVREGAIEPLIVVGLTSTDDRAAEYSPEPSGQRYMAFLVNTVKPMIDATYRTRPGPAHTLVGGSSMGGLVSFALAWDYPDVFGAAICMSPAISIEGRFDYLPYFAGTRAQHRPGFYYLDNGGIGLEERIQPGVDRLISALEQWGYEMGSDFVFVRDADARHFEAAWGERFPKALQLALAGARRVTDTRESP